MFTINTYGEKQARVGAIEGSSATVPALIIGAAGSAIGFSLFGKIGLGLGAVTAAIAYALSDKDELAPYEEDQWGVPYARTKGKIWPVVTPNKSIPAGPLAFHASRAQGKRFHAGVDLYAAPGEQIVALDDGIFLNYASGYVGLDAMVIQHGPVNVLYGEFVAVKGLKNGDPISAGQNLGTIVNSLGTSAGAVLSSMLHLETWEGFIPKAFTPWYSTNPMPQGLLDPTKMLERTLG